MTGVVLETLSNRKLITLGVTLLVVLIIFFLVGGLVAPAPANVEDVLGTKCLDIGKHRHKAHWFYTRGTDPCKSIESFDDDIVEKEGITTNQIVFTFQFPRPRDGMELDYSRWQQNIIAVLMLDIVYDEKIPHVKNTMLTMDARLGYRDKQDVNWTEIVRSTEERKLKCEDPDKKEPGYPLKCDMLPFFELGSCHHDFYLVNIRVPVHEDTGLNMGIGKLEDLHLYAINQNGGFTKVWFSIKAIVFPTLLVALAWFWKRIAQLERPPNLLEKTLFALGLTLSFLNLPIEWLTLWFDMPFMLLLSDIRQGIFYAMLLCFWIIFAGEHMMDQLERNRLVIYWKHMGVVVFGCICLFVFEMCERGVQLTNPFYSIWVTDTGANLALAFIILAGIAACLYFLFLCFMMFQVFRNISAKKSSLPHMNKARRKYYMGLIFRFKFLMIVTLTCAAATVIFFIISQVSEGHWKWGDKVKIESVSAFLTGVYGMWNLYVLGLLILYAPSHKYMAVAESGDNSSNDDVVEFTNLPSEAVSLTAFAKKAAAE